MPAPIIPMDNYLFHWLLDPLILSMLSLSNHVPLCQHASALGPKKWSATVI